MKRFYLVVASGLCSVSPVLAQPGAFAPTVPVVPMPVVQNGNLVAPAGGTGTWGAASGARASAITRWSPFRNPVAASATEPVAVAPAYHGAPVPVVPAPAAPSCVSGGCAPTRDGSRWTRFKAWLCYHPEKSELPKCVPTPFSTPLLGMFPCASGAAGCATCGAPPLGVPMPAAPVPAQPAPTKPAPTAPAPHAPGSSMMSRLRPGWGFIPLRGSPGTAVAPSWQNRMAPTTAVPAIASYNPAGPAPAPPSGTVVNTGGDLTPQK